MPSFVMNINLATEVSDAVKNVPCWDGIIGMGFKGLNTGKNSKRVSPPQKKQTRLMFSSATPQRQYLFGAASRDQQGEPENQAEFAYLHN